MERNPSGFKNLGIAKRKEAGPRERRNSYKVHYVEQEFLPMDWNCPKSDPRWEVSDLELHFAMSSYALGKIFCEFQLCMILSC